MNKKLLRWIFLIPIIIGITLFICGLIKYINAAPNMTGNTQWIIESASVHAEQAAGFGMMICGVFIAFGGGIASLLVTKHFTTSEQDRAKRIKQIQTKVSSVLQTFGLEEPCEEEKYCEYCGSKVSPEDKKCESCGASISKKKKEEEKD